jgi:prepilin-type N-terminal cleavage/methylation domain-containing protein
MRLIREFRLQSGFTLIEMAMVVLITGLILGTAASYYGLYLKRENLKETNVNVTAVTNKISEFRNINGRYPAPASLTLPRGDADYGRENKTICTNVAKAPGTCENGICIKSNSRDTDGDGTNETLRVCVGTIPFRQLNLSEKLAFDAYGTRLLYAVTEDLTDDAKFRAGGGGIDILQAQGSDSALNLPRSAHFVVLSYGPDMAGGYTADGVQIPCPAAGAENVNCSTAATASFRVAQLDQSLDNSAFDDVVNYFIRDPAPLWQISPDPTAKAQGDMIMKPTDNLGAKILVGDVDDALPNKMNVNGVLRASTEMISNQICDAAGNNCFNPSLLSGQILDPDTGTRTGGMKCPDDDPDGTGQYMVAIESGRPVCENEIAFLCPDGQVMAGTQIGAGGQIECTVMGPAPPPCTNCCPAQDTTFCGRTYTIPASGFFASLDIYDTGGTGGAWEHWYCNNTGVWQMTSNNYACGCTPDPEFLSTQSCGTGFSGTNVVYRMSKTCPGSVLNFLDAQAGHAIPVSNGCVCQESTETTMMSCANGTVLFPATRQHVCDNYDPSRHGGDYWTPWSYTLPPECACTPETVTSTQACPGGQAGYIAMEGTRTCPDGNVTGWHEVGNYCGTLPPCNPNETQQQYQSCPTGYAANPNGITVQRQRDCSTGGWTSWTQIASDCIAGPPVSCKWGGGTLLNSTPSGALSGNRRNSSCACGTSPATCYEGSSSSAYNYANCSCGG